jgi:hypothetical protein
MLTFGAHQPVRARGIGRRINSAVRTIKRTVTGQLQRDVQTIAAPVSIVADPRRGSIAALRRAVVARQVLESRLDPDYLHDLIDEISEGENAATFAEISTMAKRAVLSGSWDELAQFAYHRIDSRHWLLRELADAA